MLTLIADEAQARMRGARTVVMALAMAVLVTAAGCRSGATPGPGAGSEPGGAAGFVCAAGRDYRAFERLAALRSLDALAPRKDQTQAQKETQEPGDRVWQLQEAPEARCSPEGYLELRYAALGAAGFAASRHRVTVSIAPGGRLLDPIAHARMAALAGALDEALTTLRTKSCSPSGEPCDLHGHADPLRFAGTRSQYSVASELPKVGQRAWHWFFTRAGFHVQRELFTTTDGRFDVEVLVETADGTPEVTDSFHLLPQQLSDEYDKVGGGSHG